MINEEKNTASLEEKDIKLQYFLGDDKKDAAIQSAVLNLKYQKKIPPIKFDYQKDLDANEMDESIRERSDALRSEVLEFHKNLAKNQDIIINRVLFDSTDVLKKERISELATKLEILAAGLLEYQQDVDAPISSGLIDIKNDTVSLIEQVFSGVRYDEFGFPAHPLRAEVLDYVERVKGGEAVVVDYSTVTVEEIKEKKLLSKYYYGSWHELSPDGLLRKCSGTPFDYFVSVFGKYLSLYNTIDTDAIYLDELRLIIPSFPTSLGNYLRKHSMGVVSDYIPNYGNKALAAGRAIVSNDLSRKQVKLISSLRSGGKIKLPL